MLTCITCSSSNQLNTTTGSLTQDDENAATTKQVIKSLTSQIKDIAVKASGAYKHCKPCSRSGHDRGRGYVDSDVGSVSDRFYGSYKRNGSLDSKLKEVSCGSVTPTSVSGRSESVIFLEEDDEPKEWTAQVEPGVLITFVSLPQSQGGNDLKRIRFSREVFNKWQAQQWWTENSDKVMELYNVQKFNHPLPTLPRSEDENLKLESAEDSPITPPLSKERLPPRSNRPTRVGYSSSDSLEQHPVQSHPHYESVGLNSTPKLSSISATKTEMSSIDASARCSSSSREIDHSGELSMSNASDLENEWVEQDEPGVYITIRALPGGARELRRVRFSRERFGEMNARTWWEENRARIQQQYL